MTIGDVYLALRADGARFSVEAERQAKEAGDRAGKTLGARIGKAAGVALKGGLAVVSAGAAIATRGMVELDDAVAEFTADTGASAEEAEHARKSINAMSSRNVQPVKEIGEALSRVHTNLGLTGDAADATTEQFLAFARVTKRDAAEEVSAFDDILDAFGGTAEDIGPIMDKLIASHEKYGGAVGDNEAALAAMAPQLKALGLGLDDGIGLLNLFASSGLDAAAGQKALNAAITKLPKGTTLQDFIAHLSTIEDDGARAQAAIEVFGTKAGAGLANAIKPGVGSLDAFKISTEEATGATSRARDAIDSTWGARAQLLVKGFTSKLVELGGSFGPVLTGLASIASLGGALGGALRLDKLAGVLVKKLAEVGKAGGEALIDAVGTATGAAGTVIGNLVANALDPTNPLFGSPLRRAGNAAGAFFGKIFALGTKVGQALATLFVGLPGMGAVRSAVLASSLKIGTLAGTTMGTAMGVAMRLGIIGAVAGIADAVEPAISQAGADLGEGIRPQFLEDFGKWASDLPWPLGPRGEPNWLGMRQDTEAGAAGVVAGAEAGFAGLDDLTDRVGDDTGAIPIAANAAAEQTKAALMDMGLSYEQAASAVEGKAQAIEKANTDMWGVVIPKIEDGADAWTKYEADSKAAQDQAFADQLDFSSKSLANLIGYQSGVADAVSGVYNAQTDAQVTTNRIIILQDQLTASREEHRKKGTKISAAEQADYENSRIAIEGEMRDLRLHLALIGDDTHRETALSALLTSKDMKKGLTSENDNIRGAYEVQRDQIITALRTISTQGGPAAKKAAADLAKFLNPDNALSPLHGAGVWGGAIGREYVGDLAGGVSGNTYQVKLAIAGIRRILIAGSPPGPESPLHRIDDWGFRTGEQFPLNLAAAIEAGVRRVSAAVALIAAPLTAPLGGPELAAPDIALGRTAPVGLASPEAMSTGVATGGTNQYVLHVHGDVRATDEASVLRTLQRLSAVTVPA